MARAAHALALANPHIKADVVECQEFRNSPRVPGDGRPKTIINDRAEFVGAVPDELFVNAILESLGKPAVDWESEAALEEGEAQ